MPDQNARTQFPLCAWAHQRTGSSDAGHDGGHGGPSIVRFPELTLSLFQQLKKVFKTESGQPFIFSGSGTGAGEGLTNTLSPGTKCWLRFSQFSHL
jgi:hypothetical protein